MSRYMPEILREIESGYSQIGMDSALFEKREIYLIGEVDENTTGELIKQFLYLEKEQKGNPITFYINSPGGSVKDGLAVYDLIRMLKSPVTTVCIGTAASMGAILFLAGEKRLMLEHSEIMIHDASFSNADFSGLKPDEIQKKTKQLVKTCEILRGIVSDRTGWSLNKVKDKMKIDSFFNMQEAIDNGLATGLFAEIL